MTKNLTILDIARLAGVGKSTVSRVLNDDPKVKAATREKVKTVIQEVGFVPSKSAQLMRAGRAKVIGVILSRLDSSAENSAVSGMLTVLYGAGYDVVIMESQFSAEKTEEHLAVLKRRNVDGVILFAFSALDLAVLEQTALPAVVIAGDTARWSSVSYDDYGAIEQVMVRLLAEGKRKIAYIGVDPSDRTTGQARLQAYLDACQHYQLTPHYHTGALDYHCGYHAAEQLLQQDMEALVCATDRLALGAAKLLQSQQREDILVSGVGGSDLLRFMFPSAISVELGYTPAGEQAAHLLLAELMGERNVQHIVQPAYLPL